MTLCEAEKYQHHLTMKAVNVRFYLWIPSDGNAALCTVSATEKDNLNYVS